MDRLIQKKQRRNKRKLRIRKRILGTAERPRLTVYKSLKYFYLQVIDDQVGHTLLAISNIQKENKDYQSNVDGAKQLAEVLANKAKEKGLTTMLFDRNGYRYHGVIKSIVDTIRDNGITI